MGGVKKSLYVFVSSLLGVMLFLVLHRLAVFCFMILSAYGVIRPWGVNYQTLLAADYATLLVTLLAGSWYGIWVGTYWYEQVYEHGAWKGAFYHIGHRLFPWRRSDYRLQEGIERVREGLAQELRQVSELAESFPPESLAARAAVPLRRRAVAKPRPKITVRRRAVAKP